MIRKDYSGRRFSLRPSFLSDYVAGPDFELDFSPPSLPPSLPPTLLPCALPRSRTKPSGHLGAPSLNVVAKGGLASGPRGREGDERRGETVGRG